MWGFFGLGSEYKAHIYNQIFDLMYYGKMGWTWTELYKLPVHIRNYYYRKLVDIKEEENKQAQTQVDQAKSSARRR